MYLTRAAIGLDAAADAMVDYPVSPWVVLLIAAHVPLAVVITHVTPLAAVHAGLVVLIGLQWATFGLRVDRVAYITAYITGSEVFWRMTNDRLPWELGKYSVALVCIVAILRLRGVKGLLWPALAFALYLPSTGITIMDLSAAEARGQIAFNLSGPLALVLCATFFLSIQLTPSQLRRTLIALIAPVAGIATVVVYGIAMTPEIVWTTESNFATSGGFGPNQVSAALGLGALAAFLCTCDQRSGAALRVICVGAMLWFATQSILTFSRGGLYCAAGGAIVSAFFLVQNSQTRLKVVIVGIVIYVVGTTLVWPQLDKFTGGAISARYEDIEATGRLEIGQDDFAIWMANPMFGVGPGRSRFFHFNGAASHTEFTRLIAEHGIFGLTAIGLMVMAGLGNLKRAETAREKAIVAAVMCWSVLFMLSAAMRIVAPSFMFGLAFATFVPVARMRIPAPRTLRMRPSLRRTAYA